MSDRLGLRWWAIPTSRFMRTLDAAAALAAANKRVSNILAKSDEVLSDRVNASTLKEPEEIKLATTAKDVAIARCVTGIPA